MTYGVCSTETRAWIERRAAQSGISMTAVDLESEAEDSLDISITFEGALDEEFAVGAEYGSTVLDWIRELMWDTYPKDFWEVELSRESGDGSSERLDYAASEER